MATAEERTHTQQEGRVGRLFSRLSCWKVVPQGSSSNDQPPAPDSPDSSRQSQAKVHVSQRTSLEAQPQSQNSLHHQQLSHEQSAVAPMSQNTGADLITFVKQAATATIPVPPPAGQRHSSAEDRIRNRQHAVLSTSSGSPRPAPSSSQSVPSSGQVGSLPQWPPLMPSPPGSSTYAARLVSLPQTPQLPPIPRTQANMEYGDASVSPGPHFPRNSIPQRTKQNTLFHQLPSSESILPRSPSKERDPSQQDVLLRSVSGTAQGLTRTGTELSLKSPPAVEGISPILSHQEFPAEPCRLLNGEQEGSRLAATPAKTRHSFDVLSAAAAAGAGNRGRGFGALTSPSTLSLRPFRPDTLMKLSVGPAGCFVRATAGDTSHSSRHAGLSTAGESTMMILGPCSGCTSHDVTPANLAARAAVSEMSPPLVPFSALRAAPPSSTSPPGIPAPASDSLMCTQDSATNVNFTATAMATVAAGIADPGLLFTQAAPGSNMAFESAHGSASNMGSGTARLPSRSAVLYTAWDHSAYGQAADDQEHPRASRPHHMSCPTDAAVSPEPGGYGHAHASLGGACGAHDEPAWPAPVTAWASWPGGWRLADNPEAGHAMVTLQEQEHLQIMKQYAREAAEVARQQEQQLQKSAFMVAQNLEDQDVSQAVSQFLLNWPGTSRRASAGLQVPEADTAAHGSQLGRALQSEPLQRLQSQSVRRTLAVSSTELQEAVRASLMGDIQQPETHTKPPQSNLDLELSTLNISKLDQELFGLVMIGRGGGGLVFRAVWQGAQVAVKFMIGKTSAAVSMAALEAVLAASVNHPHVVQTYGFDVTKLRESSFRQTAPNSEGECEPGFSSSAMANIVRELEREKARMEARVQPPVGGGIQSHNSVGSASRSPPSIEDNLSHHVHSHSQASYTDRNMMASFNSEEGFGDPVESLPANGWSPAQVLTALSAQPGMFMTHIIMEFCDRGTLLSALQRGVFRVGGTSGDASRFNDRVVLRAALRTARDVARGMQHLHASGIIHGDLKPGNVLLKGSRNDRRGFTAKVADFGLSKVVKGDGPLEMPHWSTVTHMAPEVIQGTWCKQSDVYSFGVLLWQLMCGEPLPFKDLTIQQLITCVSQGRLRLQWPPHCHPAIAKLGEACVGYEATTRPTFQEIGDVLVQIEQNVRNELRWMH